MHSLGLLLRSSKAAHTRLSISIADWGPYPEKEEEDWGVWPTCEALQEAGEKLSELSIPCRFIGTCLNAVRSLLPQVRSLVLRLPADCDVDVDALDDTDSEVEEVEREGGGKAKVFNSQLTTLTLQAQPGIPPICIYDHDAERPLQLQRYPSLQHLTLIGPIVCEQGEPPFLLPSDTKVSCAWMNACSCWHS